MNTCSNIKSFDGLSSYVFFLEEDRYLVGLEACGSSLKTDDEGITGISKEDFAAEIASLG
jgi:hypothetical protein